MLHSSTAVAAILKMTVFSLNVLIVFLVFAQCSGLKECPQSMF